MANQFAAMPSLHFGWALMVAIGLIAATRSRWRWLWLLHPLVTLLVIVGTANHYWLDAIVAGALLGVALAVIQLPHRTATTAGPAHQGPRAGRGARPGGSGPMNATLVAVALSLVSAVAYAAAAVAQERLASRSADAGVRRMLASGAWWGSVALNAGAALLHVVALKYGPLTVVQPLGALTLVAAVPLGARVAGRRVTATEWRGTALTLAGLAAILVVGVRAGPRRRPERPGGPRRRRCDGRADRLPGPARRQARAAARECLRHGLGRRLRAHPDRHGRARPTARAPCSASRSSWWPCWSRRSPWAVSCSPRPPTEAASARPSPS